MSRPLSVIHLARHSETAWSLSGRHTGKTDLPLTERGERNARALAGHLRELSFGKVFSSPLRRAVRTCEPAGFGTGAETDPALVEWDHEHSLAEPTVRVGNETRPVEDPP